MKRFNAGMKIAIFISLIFMSLALMSLFLITGKTDRDIPKVTTDDESANSQFMQYFVKYGSSQEACPIPHFDSEVLKPMFQSARPVQPKFRYHNDIARRLLTLRTNNTAEVVLDIGANIGLCTEMAATLGHVTIGVEAVSKNNDIATIFLLFRFICSPVTACPFSIADCDNSFGSKATIELAVDQQAP
jgi:hypothetical protein